MVIFLSPFSETEYNFVPSCWPSLLLQHAKNGGELSMGLKLGEDIFIKWEKSVPVKAEETFEYSMSKCSVEVLEFIQ